ncbi:pentatricopeptide repeat-containing protein At5g66500, mitochondrial [Corylus avellana]|uniref:pentatricopeptide repeat-containing protein At5g66500, mitochondrial n=1 Tax=Corylus avellana TaxID=13451 RepID=UPI00286D5D88|nr:pentatricopeptide repeat-containing protein At5g66500, mitochondrial [Corylus avellana]
MSTSYSSLRNLRSLNFPANSIRTVSSKNLHTHLFDETPHRDLYSLNSLLASYVRDDNALAAWALFRRMHCTRSDLDAYTFTPMLGACSKLPGHERGKQVHALMIKRGSDSGAVSKTALMDMYSKYGYLGDSIKVFDEMEFRDVVTWNAMLSSFLRHGLAKEALGVFEAMRRERVECSEFTLCSVLKACASLKAFRQGKQVHGLVVVMGRDLVVLGTALIDFYSSIGCIEEAITVFSSLDRGKDDMMRNSLISGCVRNRKYEEAFSIMCLMKPNVVALTSALAACAENSDLWIGKQIHCVALRQGFLHDTQLCNIMLDMYAKCGKILSARLLFDGICNKSVVSWTSMIDAYGRHGHGLEALELYKMMGEEGSGVLPNSVTFLALLSACGHSGLVDQGRECFNSAREKHALELGPEHYACFIDILGRAGLIEEAWCLFHDMVKHGTMPTAAVWAALLNACSHNMDVTRGEFAANRLLQLEPNKPGNYVLLSNFYAAIGRWDSVNELRNVSNTKGLVKEAGSSWVAVTTARRMPSAYQSEKSKIIES